MNSAKLSKQSLRRNLIRQRLALSAAIKRKKARELLKTISPLAEFKQAKRIAFYWPSKGEIDPRPILHLALKMGKRCYLPLLHPSKTKHLLFVEYHKGDKLHLNRYGVKEPRFGVRSPLAASMLNTIFVPLLAFTKEGQRLGRGGGYYDKTFAFLLKGWPLRGNLKKKDLQPKLIGLAYEFQQLDSLPQEEWDLLLSGIATEKQFLRPTPLQMP